MGGGPTAEKILCLLPGPEPKEILDRIRARYPTSEVTYISKAFGTDASDLGGKCNMVFSAWSKVLFELD
jgi:hypothetical protein